MRETVAVLSFSRIAQDQRVLRQCDLITEMGLPVTVVGYAAAQDHIDHDLAAWPLPAPTLSHRLGTVARQLPAHTGAWAATAGFWASPRYRWALRKIAELNPRIVLANDWPALVVAARWKRQTPGLVHYDSHEFATREFDERPWWRIMYKPFVTHLEARAISAADSISTVSPGLANELRQHYNLSALPTVIRSTPRRIPLLDIRETQWPLRLLFHGQILPDRGLEALIDSIPQWQTPHRLTIRGNGNPSYIAALRKRVQDVGRQDQVTFECAVLPHEVIPAAARSADVGVFFTPLRTTQHWHVLPNKIFEYISAGLAVAVSPGHDLQALVTEHQVGVVSDNASSSAIAAVINGLTRDIVTDFRVKARAAAQVLCWENERERLRVCLQALMARASGGQ